MAQVTPLHRDSVDRVLYAALRDPTAIWKSRRHVEWDVSGDCSRPVLRELFARCDGPRGERAVTTAKEGPAWAELWTRCRRCHKCMRRRARSWTARARHEVGQAVRTWMSTLTFQPELRHRALSSLRHEWDLEGLDFDAEPDEVKFRELCSWLGQEFTKYLKRVRKECKGSFRYVCVYERHKDGFPHLHILFSETGDLAELRWKTLSTQWRCGYSNHRLLKDARAVLYATKYIAKSFARVRASLHYGAKDCLSNRRKGEEKADPPGKGRNAVDDLRKWIFASMGSDPNGEIPDCVPEWFEPIRGIERRWLSKTGVRSGLQAEHVRGLPEHAAGAATGEAQGFRPQLPQVAFCAGQFAHVEVSAKRDVPASTKRDRKDRKRASETRRLSRRAQSLSEVRIQVGVAGFAALHPLREPARPGVGYLGNPRVLEERSSERCSRYTLQGEGSGLRLAPGIWGVHIAGAVVELREEWRAEPVKRGLAANAVQFRQWPTERLEGRLLWADPSEWNNPLDATRWDGFRRGVTSALCTAWGEPGWALAKPGLVARLSWRLVAPVSGYGNAPYFSAGPYPTAHYTAEYGSDAAWIGAFGPRAIARRKRVAEAANAAVDKSLSAADPDTGWFGGPFPDTPAYRNAEAKRALEALTREWLETRRGTSWKPPSRSKHSPLRAFVDQKFPQTSAVTLSFASSSGEADEGEKDPHSWPYGHFEADS